MRTRIDRRALVIGGGLGGLSAAIHLRSRGWAVDLLERGEQPGGKCNQTHWEGHHFDTGPSLITLPQVLERLFREAGARMEDYLQLERLDPAVSYFFSDGRRFDAPGTLAGWEAAVAREFPQDLQGWRRFMARNRRLWEVSLPVYLDAPLNCLTPWRVPYGKALRALPDLFPRKMGPVLRGDFADPHLLQLYSRYATYNGSEPERTPATFNVIAYAEAAFGSWHIRGGIYQLVKALVKLAEELGVKIHLNCEADRLHFSHAGRRLKSVRLADGREWQADGVVVNMDAVSALHGSLFSEHPRSARWREELGQGETSVSGYVLLLAVDREVNGLSCHNIFFNPDYDREFAEIFSTPGPLSDPTLYLHIPGKIDPTLSPAGCESWFLLVNAPPLDRNAEWPASYPDFLLELLESRLRRHGVDFSREWVRWQRAHSPHFFAETYKAWQGSLYGLSSNSLRQAFFRIPNRSPVRGVAFAGGSAHPGGGIPLVLTSGRLAADALQS